MKCREIISCRIAQNAISINGKEQFASVETDAEIFLKELYRFLETDYNKFFKMDSFSKLGFLAVEALVKYHPAIKSYSDDEVALLCANRHSSMETDSHFWNGIKANPPVASPALFVYTLPNIMLGEIAIRRRWFGENACLVAEAYDKGMLHDYAAMLMEAGKAKACIAGWADFYKNTYEAEFSLLVLTENERSANLISG